MRIGIDAGRTLIKLAYEEKGIMRVRKYDVSEMKKLLEWLHIMVPNATLIGTGENWSALKESLQSKSHSVGEFNAVVNGTNYLLQNEKVPAEEFVLVSIGTGTSIFYVHRNGFEQLLFNEIGGGTWMGLGSLLTNTANFHELIEKAAKGERENIDLLEKDTYRSNETSFLLSELTAAKFGNAHLNNNNNDADRAVALNQLIGEVILSLTRQAAASKNVQQIIFIGSMLEGNKSFKNVLASFQHVRPYEVIFLENGAYAGAIGALIEG